MSVKNSYPSKPELPYRKTKVEMPDVVIYLKQMPVSMNVKRAAYVMFRIESANGKSGICNNYAGLQGDSGSWPKKYDHLITGTCIKEENGTGKVRRFLCFDTFKDFMEMYVDRIKERGLYIGGYAHLIAKMVITTEREFARAYEKDWVKGNKAAEPSEVKIANILSMYSQAKAIFK